MLILEFINVSVCSSGVLGGLLLRSVCTIQVNKLVKIHEVMRQRSVRRSIGTAVQVFWLLIFVVLDRGALYFLTWHDC